MNIINNTRPNGYHILAHDSDGSVSSGHLRLGDHVQHLNENTSLGQTIVGPLCQVELGHCEAIQLFSICRL